MGHEIDMTTGKAAFAHVGDKGWHGLGQQLTEGAPIETWRVEAGMNWNVVPADVHYKVEDQDLIMPERQLLYRSDTKKALSIVSDNYRIVQPEQVLEFFRDLIEGQGFQLETAGVLFEGRKFFAMARTGKSVKIKGVDEISPYLLLATSCDGSLATCAHFTSVRVVCNNTLRMAIGDSGRLSTIKIPHNATFAPDQVKAKLGIHNDAWMNFLAQCEILSEIKLDRDQAIDIVARELKDNWKTDEGDDMSSDQMLEASTVLSRIIGLYDGKGKGAELVTTKGTAWGLVNAVTEFFDHHTGSSEDGSRSFERAHLTDRAKFKTSVADKLLELA